MSNQYSQQPGVPGSMPGTQGYAQAPQGGYQPSAYAPRPAQPQPQVEPAPAGQPAQAGPGAAADAAQQQARPAMPVPPAPEPVAAKASASGSVAAKKRNYVPIIVILALAAIIVVGVASCAHSMSKIGGAFGEESNSFTGNTVAVITLDGTIQYDGSSCSPEGLKALLDEAAEDDHVKAVVLRVNSGGGTATAGEEMATYVRDFEKPIVVSSAAINASAAYEISSQADYIYTAKTTEIGAIGTVMQVTDYSGLLEKLGVDIDNIASAESKDSSYGTRPLTDEERQYYQDMIDEINSVFIENVAEGRGMTVDEASELATGLTWTGLTAVENGVADEIGTFEDACDKAAELGECADDYETHDLYIGYNYSEIYDLLDLLSSTDSSGTYTSEDIARALKELSEHDTTIH